jgi:tRNA(Ile)-lysidine synthase
MAARRLRHSFLARAARRWGIGKVLLGHHADDNTELFFLRVLRGSGGDGLGGMKWLSPSPADARVQLARPLLGCTKAELEQWAKRQGIVWREDRSNESKDIPRNRVRHELLPLLREKYQPALDQAVRRLMEIVGDEAAFAESGAACWLAAPGDRLFSELPVAVQRRCLRISLAKQGIEAGWEQVEQLRLNPGKPVVIRPDARVRRNAAGEVELVPAQVAVPFEAGAKGFRLRGTSGEFQFGDRLVAWRIVRHESGFDWRAKPANTEYFDAALAGRRITLRHWRPGDRFQPIGLKQSAKLQNLFVNRRIPRDQRRRLLLAESPDGRVFWVEGLRIGEVARLREGTTRRLEWSWRRIEN